MPDEVAVPVKPKSLVEKLCEVGDTLTWIQKRGKNTFHGYNYATEADLVLAIRKELYARKVFLTGSLKSQKREAWTEGGDEKKPPKRKAITDLEFEWTWRDGETGETLSQIVPGCGEDASDKGIYKAMTGSEKYLLMKTFLIPTYDDAEAMTGGDKKEAQKRVAVQRTAELKAKQAAHSAQSEEDAANILKKGKVLFITAPNRFHGEFVAVFGEPIQDAALQNFFADVNAQRYKSQEGIIHKLEMQYARDAKALAEKQGYTVSMDLEGAGEQA